MDYNEWLLNEYVVNLAPIFSQEWFHTAVGVLAGGTTAAQSISSIVQALNSFIGENSIDGIATIFTQWFDDPIILFMFNGQINFWNQWDDTKAVA